jgi:hypothetical protein
MRKFGFSGPDADQDERITDSYAGGLFNFRRRPSTGVEIPTFNQVNYQMLGKITQRAPVQSLRPRRKRAPSSGRRFS